MKNSLFASVFVDGNVQERNCRFENTSQQENNRFYGKTAVAEFSFCRHSFFRQGNLIFCLFLLMGLIVCGLAGCGSKKEEKSSPSSAPVSAPKTTQKNNDPVQNSQNSTQNSPNSQNSSPDSDSENGGAANLNPLMNPGENSSKNSPNNPVDSSKTENKTESENESSAQESDVQKILEDAKTFVPGSLTKAEWFNKPEIDETQLESLGIRKLSGKYVDVYTDFPENSGYETLPKMLDQEVLFLSNFFGFSISEFDSWKVDAFLIQNRKPFDQLGALKDVPEETLNLPGYSMQARLWVFDQKNRSDSTSESAKDSSAIYYNRFLMFHELVHSYMDYSFGTLRPRWYTEGIAERIALYRCDENKPESIEFDILPVSREETPGFGRVKTIRKAVQENNIVSIEKILQFVPEDFSDTDAYAWSWAFSLFLENHPLFKDLYKTMPYRVLKTDPSEEFRRESAEKQNALELDWAQFILSFDFGCLTPLPLDVKAGEPVSREKTIAVSSTSGWMNTGVLLSANQDYTLTASGDYQLYFEKPSEKLAQTFKSDADGLSLDYLQGMRIGGLQMMIIPSDPFKTGNSANRRFGKPSWSNSFSSKSSSETDKMLKESISRLSNALSWVDPVFVGKSVSWKNRQEGTLFLKLNLPAYSFEKNQGEINVEIIPVTP